MTASSWGLVILFAIGVALLLWRLWRRNTRVSAAVSNEAEWDVAVQATASLHMPDWRESLRVTADELIEGSGPGARRYPLVGLVASVGDSGTLTSRVTATRVAAVGLFALAIPKKLDDRALYLTIEGPATAIVRAVGLKDDPTAAMRVRQFALDLNMAARAKDVTPS